MQLYGSIPASLVTARNMSCNNAPGVQQNVQIFEDQLAKVNPSRPFQLSTKLVLHLSSTQAVLKR